MRLFRSGANVEPTHAGSNRPRLSILVLAILSLLLPFFAASTAHGALVPIDLQRLTGLSRYIVRGEVVAVESHWGQFAGTGRVLITDVRIRVRDTWKDTPGARRGVARGRRDASGKLVPSPDGPLQEVTVQFLGGRIGERWQHCPESPRFEKGEQVVVFVRELNGRLWTAGWLQGKYRVHRVPSTDGSGKPVEIVAGHSTLPVKKSQPVAELRTRVREIAKRQREARASQVESIDHGAEANSPPQASTSLDREVKR